MKKPNHLGSAFLCLNVDLLRLPSGSLDPPEPPARIYNPVIRSGTARPDL
ncbi:MAG TPA: hypothetical protein VF598_01295 [Hymenobacter sp.]